MKKDIHPKYYPNAKVTCACGATFTTGSTEAEIHVEICSSCHPFYSNTHKFIDTAGRLDNFKARLEKTKEKMQSKGNKPAKIETSDKKQAKKEKMKG